MMIDPTDDLARELRAVAAAWEHHLTDVQVKCDRICGVHKLLYTWALLADVTPGGYEDRWCYSSYEKAKAALDAWSGEDGTEPAGFHRHPDSGRRRDPDGTEYIMP
jgi:hypothetical protein